MDFTLNNLVAILGSLAGFAGVFTLAVGIGKRFGWIKDGQAEGVYTGLSIIGLGAIWVVQFFVPTFFPGVPSVSLPQVDAWLGAAVKIGTAILELLALLKVGPAFYEKMRGIVPVLGYSHTLAKAQRSSQRNT